MKNIADSLFIASITFLLFSGHAAAEVYKCVNEAGKIVFSDNKCGNNSELVKIKKFKQQVQRPAARPFVCISGISAVANNLLYPELEDVNEAIRLAESDFTSLRYRKLIRKMDPDGGLPDRVSKITAEAFPASEVPGFTSGVVVNVRICK